MPGLKLITAPTIEPVSLVEARNHLKLEATGSPPTHPDDALVSSLIKTTRMHLDGRDGLLSRALITQTWELVLDKFPDSDIRIRLAPLQSIVSVKYDDPNAVEQTVASSNYMVDITSMPGWVVPITGFAWPVPLDTINAVRIRFVAGYGAAASDVPEPIRQAMLLLIGHWYENRELVALGHIAPEFPYMVNALLSPYELITIT
jgi:uncharacterized phiE125 gp8 family phage protein